MCIKHTFLWIRQMVLLLCYIFFPCRNVLLMLKKSKVCLFKPCRWQMAHIPRHENAVRALCNKGAVNFDLSCAMCRLIFFFNPLSATVHTWCHKLAGAGGWVFFPTAAASSLHSLLSQPRVSRRSSGRRCSLETLELYLSFLTEDLDIYPRIVLQRRYIVCKYK